MSETNSGQSPLASQSSNEEILAPVTELTTDELKRIVADVTAQDAALDPNWRLTEDSSGAWSISKLKCLKKCPFQFYLKYVLKYKLPAHYQIQDDPYSQNRGKAAHEILELVMIGKKVDVAYKTVRANYVDKKILTEDQWRDGVESLHYNITRFAERIEEFGRRNPIKRVLTELKIGLTRDYEPTGFFADDVWLRGVIDLIIMLENGDVLILDHKTGGGMGGTKHHEFQLDMYGLMTHFGVQKIQGAQSGIHYIEAGEVPMAKYAEAAHIEKHVKELWEFTLQGAIESVEETGFFKHIRGNHCKWCEFDQMGCKSKDLKPVELGTKKFFQIKAI